VESFLILRAIKGDYYSMVPNIMYFCTVRGNSFVYTVLFTKSASLAVPLRGQSSHDCSMVYFLGCAVGGKSPFNRRYIAAKP
jgi:hypothetical protein